MSHLLRSTANSAVEFLESLNRRPAGAIATREELLRALGGPLPHQPRSDDQVIRELMSGVEPGLVASAGPRYFGFVVGGAVPAALAADWLTSTWDQNAQVYATSPAAAVVEEIVAGWLLALLALPSGSSVGFVTGSQMAHFTALAVGRQAVLRRVGWDFDEIADLCRDRGAWVHVDGAFGLWAAASPRLRSRVAGLDRADSWAVDAHKWLNVPYDSGMVIIRDPAEHQRLKSQRCAYAGTAAADRRDGSTWVPENSRRARAFVLYAALRSLGSEGVRLLIERCCDRAAEFATGVGRLQHAVVVNEVVLNQVLVRFQPPQVSDLDQFHEELAAAVQRDGRCWMGTSRWKGHPVLRFSASNWSTTAGDVQDALESLESALEEVLHRRDLA